MFYSVKETRDFSLFNQSAQALLKGYFIKCYMPKMYVHILLDILQSKPVVFGLRFSLGSSDNESIIQTIHCAETSEADPENSLENEENATRKRARIVNEDNGNSDSSEPEVIEQTTAQPEKKRVQGSITSFFPVKLAVHRNRQKRQRLILK